MNYTTFSVLRDIQAASFLSKTLWETITEAVSPKGQNPGPASSVGADVPGGAPLQAEQGRSVKVHVSSSWEKKPRRHPDQPAAMAQERGTVHKAPLLQRWARAAPLSAPQRPPVLSCTQGLRMARGLHGAHVPQRKYNTRAGRAAWPSHGDRLRTSNSTSKGCCEDALVGIKKKDQRQA